MKRWHLRTVRNGYVKILGREYRPSEQHMLYDGRLEGHRFLFGLYLGQETTACLWGTEAAYRDYGNDSSGPELVDGTYPWYFWHAK